MDLLGIRVMMEDYELIELLGGNPVHLSKKGYTKLAESLINIVERPGALFAGEKRGREEGESVGDTEMIGSWHYKYCKHERLQSQVSGSGGWGVRKTG
jgi:hypothetical protein